MQKTFISFILSALVATPSVAAEKDLQKELAATKKAVESSKDAKVSEGGPWSVDSTGSLQFSQAAFDNWAGGGEDSVAWQGRFKLDALYSHEKNLWENRLHLGYGKSKIGAVESRKSLDELLAETRYSYKAWEKVHPFASARFESQLDEGFDFSGPRPVRTSKFLDPGYLTDSVGLAWVPCKEFKSYFGFSAKHTFTDKHPAPYADDPDTLAVETSKSEYGLSSVSELKWNITKTAQFSSTLDLFSNLEGGEEIDAKWKNALAFKVSSYISTNVELDVFYDQDVSKKRQLRQALTLGLSYTFL